MINEQKTNLHEYCEQEGITHDDVINEEIEQEHKEKNGKFNRVEVEKSSDSCQKLISDKYNNPNYFPMSVKFNLEAIKFIDMTEFNNKVYRPNEVDAERKKYIISKLNDEIYKTLKELQSHIESKEYCTTSMNASSKPFDNLDYMLKGLFTEAMKNLNL